jgi:hypothetical protein
MLAKFALPDWLRAWVKPLKKWLKWAGAGGFAGFVALQFFNPPHINPPVVPERDVMAGGAMPLAVAVLLKNACYNCHSYETHWPWYSYVAPVSWSVVGHVNDARDVLNFSDWPNDNPARARKRWRHVANAISSGDMPFPGYSLMHREARLTAAQRQLLTQWAQNAGELEAGK